MGWHVGVSAADPGLTSAGTPVHVQDAPGMGSLGGGPSQGGTSFPSGLVRDRAVGARV